MQDHATDELMLFKFSMATV